MGLIDRILSPWVQPRVEQRISDLMGGFLPLREGTYDTAFDFPFGQPYQGTIEKGPMSWPAADRIREWTVAERADILLRCHLVWERNPLAKGAIKTIRGFVVSSGLNVTYQNSRVREVLEGFRNENRRRIQRWERQWFDQLLVDGEVFVRLTSNRQSGELSRVAASTIKPWLVEAVESEAGNRDEVVAYHVRGETGTGAPSRLHQEGAGNLEVVPAEDIVHCYINALAYDVRGRSELFVILPWLRAYREWLENRARINRYKGFLYHLQMRGATGGQVASKRSAFKQPPAPGSVYVSSDAEELKELGGGVDAGQVAEDGRQIKIMNLAGLGLPEYMLTEGQSANLATARAQQLPALRGFLTYQDIYIEELWRPLYEAVLELSGLDLDAEVETQDEEGKGTGQQVKVRAAFEITAMPIVDEDPKSLAEALTLHSQNGWASRETLASRAGYDWAKEKKLLAAEDEEEANDVALGRKLGAVPFPEPPEEKPFEEPGEEGNA